MDNKSPIEIQRMASIYKRCGKYELAEQLYWTLFSMKPLDRNLRALALVRLGELYTELGRTVEASAYFRRALEIWDQKAAS